MTRWMLAAALLCTGAALAQDGQQGADPQAPPADTAVQQQQQEPPPQQDVPREAPVQAEPVLEPQTKVSEPPPEQQPAALEPVPEGAMLDGQLREGAFLAGPGSLPFILHHTILGAAGGLATQGFAARWQFDRGGREQMLIGTLVGAGIGFGFSSWWQFNHWIDRPMAYYGIANSAVGGLFLLGLMDLFSNDPTVLAWTGLIGAELGAWLTATIAGGQMPARRGLAIASGAGWGAAYAALLLAIIGNSGQPPRGEVIFDTLALSAGAGAGLMALAGLRYDPTSSQILRADLFGAGVGAAVLVLSALVLGGFNVATPYVLSLLGATGAIAAVSLLWEETAERTPSANAIVPVRKEPYRTIWW